MSKPTYDDSTEDLQKRIKRSGKSEVASVPYLGASNTYNSSRYFRDVISLDLRAEQHPLLSPSSTHSLSLLRALSLRHTLCRALRSAIRRKIHVFRCVLPSLVPVGIPSSLYNGAYRQLGLREIRHRKR